MYMYVYVICIYVYTYMYMYMYIHGRNTQKEKEEKTVFLDPEPPKSKIQTPKSKILRAGVGRTPSAALGGADSDAPLRSQGREGGGGGGRPRGNHPFSRSPSIGGNQPVSRSL